MRGPLTRAEAEKYRYCTWAGDQKGRAFDPARCAHEVYERGLFYQCSRKPGHGPDEIFCKQHAKRLAAKP